MDELVLTTQKFAEGWQLYYRGVVVHRRYSVIKKLEYGYLVKVPVPEDEILMDGTVRSDMANVKTCNCKKG